MKVNLFTKSQKTSNQDLKQRLISRKMRDVRALLNKAKIVQNPQQRQVLESILDGLSQVKKQMRENQLNTEYIEAIESSKQLLIASGVKEDMVNQLIAITPDKDEKNN